MSRAQSTPAPRTAGEMLALARPFLERHGLESARREAEILVAHALGLERLQLFMQLERPVLPEEVVAARELLVRRSRGEPAAYLTGTREFYGRGFQVGPGVLVPRPETELIVDRARDWLRDRGEARPETLRVADLGTGSGCLAITLALELEPAVVVGTDVSAEALAFARANAEALGAAVEWREGDGLAALGSETFDLVVMNPPYVDRSDTAALAEDVRQHEPELALFAPSDDPDSWARSLVAAAPTLLAPGGVLLVELGYDQAERLRTSLAGVAGVLAFRSDLAGIDRVLEWSAEAAPVAGRVPEDSIEPGAPEPQVEPS